MPWYKVLLARFLGLPWTIYARLCRPFVLLENARSRAAEDLARDGVPTLYFAWHENSTLTLVLNQKEPAFADLIGITHDQVLTLSMTLPAAYMGFRMFVFTLRDKDTRAEQICEAFRQSNAVILMADSGGPLHSVKAGIVRIARMANARLVPLRFQIDKHIVIGGKRRHVLPFPGACVRYSIGADVDCEDTETEVIQRCNQAMNA